MLAWRSLVVTAVVLSCALGGRLARGEGVGDRRAAPEFNEYARVRLEMSAPPPGCPSPERLTTLVEGALGRRVFHGAESELVLRARFEPTANGWAAILKLRGGRGEDFGDRRLESPAPSCSALDERLGLVLALMIDLPRKEVVLRLKPPPEPPKPPVLTAPTVHLGARLALGWLATAAPGARLEVGSLAGGRLPLLVAGEVWPSGRAGGDDGDYVARAWALSLGVCTPFAELPGMVALGGCLEARSGAVEAEGRGLARREVATTPFGGFALGVRLRRRLVGPVGVEASADAALTTGRLRVLAAPPGSAPDAAPRVLHEATPVHAFAGLAIFLASGW